MCVSENGRKNGTFHLSSPSAPLADDWLGLFFTLGKTLYYFPTSTKIIVKNARYRNILCASYVIHWLCWLCVFGFGLFRAFLSLGPICWRNCLVLYAFAYKRGCLEENVLGERSLHFPSILLPFCHLDLVTCCKIHLFPWLIWGSGEQ